MNPTEKTTEPNESRKWSILLGIAIVARVLIGVATREDPFLIFANLLVLFILGKLAAWAFLRSGDRNVSRAKTIAESSPILDSGIHE